MVDRLEFLTWCASLFNEPIEKLAMSTPRSDIKEWDSMGSLLLMADLDEMYGIAIDEEGIRALKTLADLAALIDSRSKASG